MKNLVNKHYYSWSVKDGDYDLFLREKEQLEKQRRTKRIRNLSIFSFIFSVLMVAGLYFYSKFF